MLTDVQTGNAVGSVFTKQWPEMKHIFQSRNLKTYAATSQTGYVAEKLDGSNVAVTSARVIASRRNILLREPSAEELQKTKFSGVTLVNVAAMFPKLDKLKVTFAKDLQNLEFDIILYGELIQKGTATSAQDKFKYRERGFEVGGYCIFGGGLYFEENISEEKVEETAAQLRLKGFSVLVHQNELTNNCHLVILMNSYFKQMLYVHDIINVISHEQLSLHQILEVFQHKLMSNAVEGIVVNFGDEILKWKGLDESYPDLFMTDIESLANDVYLKGVYDPIHKVALESRKHWASMKREKATLFLLEKAYKSALSKIKSLEDRRLGGQLGHQEITDFQQALEIEMIKDANCDIDFQERLPAFVQSKIKSIQ